jgi:hypothetical protein
MFRGTNDIENLVLLTAREHYVCHKLLTKIYKGNRKIANAFHRMTFDKQGRHNITSRDYSYARELKTSTPISKETREKMKNHIFSDKHKENLKLSHLGLKYENRVLDRSGELNTFFGKKHTDEAKEKMRQKKIGTHQSEITKEKRSISMIGQNSYLRSDETKQKMSNNRKGKTMSDKSKQKISIARKEYFANKKLSQLT